MSKETTVLIIDDHQIVRLGLQDLVNEVIPFAKIVHASNAVEIKKELQNPNLNMIVSDLRIPGVEVIHILENQLKINPKLNVLIFSVCSELTHAKYCYSIGCKGYLEKKAVTEELKKALEMVYLGKRYVSSNLYDVLFNSVLTGNNRKSIDSLSKKEQYIANCLMDGDTTKEICNKLNLKPSTISTFKKRVFEKLEISSVVELIELYKDFVK